LQLYEDNSEKNISRSNQYRFTPNADRIVFHGMHSNGIKDYLLIAQKRLNHTFLRLKTVIHDNKKQMPGTKR